MANYYPLSLENEWQYTMHDGSTYTKKIINASGNQFIIHNNNSDTCSVIKTDGHLITTDLLEPGNFQPWLTCNLTKRDNWIVKFRVSGLKSICMLIMTVRETAMDKEVEGKMYSNVILIEAENKILVNDGFISLNLFTQYYYAEDIGLILATSSAGDNHALTKYTVK